MPVEPRLFHPNSAAPQGAATEANAQRAPSLDSKSLDLAPGQMVLVRQGAGEARLEAALDDKLPDGCVRVAAAHPSTAGLGAMFGSLSVARIEMEQAA